MTKKQTPLSFWVRSFQLQFVIESGSMRVEWSRAYALPEQHRRAG